MAWYVLFPIFITVFALAFYKKKWAAPIIVFLLFFFSAFRGDKVGTDTLNYMDWDSISYKARLFSSEDVSFEDFGGKVEVLNNGLNALVYYGNLPARLIIIIYSLVTLLTFVLSAKSFKVNITISCLFLVLLGFYFYSFNTARQICACSIVLLSYNYLKYDDYRKWLFFLLVLLATSIHSFSICAVPCFFSRWIKLNRKVIGYIALAISLVLLLVNIPFVPKLVELFVSDKISRYAIFYLENNNSLNIVGKVFNCLWVFFLYYFYVNTNQEQQKTNVFDSLFLISIVVFSLFAPYSGIVGRINQYVSIFQCIYLTNSYLSNKSSLYRKGHFYINPYSFLFFLMALYFCSSIGTKGSLASGYYMLF